MAVQLAAALPTVGRMAMQYLPQIIGLSAAYKPLMEGRPVDALVQGGLGFLGGKTVQGPVTGLAQRAMGQSGRIANMLNKPGMAPAIQKALGYGIPLSAVALAPTIANAVAPGASTATGAAQNLGGNLVQGSAGLLGYQAPGAADYSGAALPPNLGMYGGVTPYGLPTDVLGPAGMGQRLQTLKDAETMRDAMRLLLPEEYKAAEARSKSEMARLMAAAGIRQNIETRANMQQAAQTAGLNAGLNALNTAGQAVTRQYQYS